MAIRDAIYIGDVTHKRVTPVAHGLRYRVFSLLLDCESLGSHRNSARLFSHNRFNLISLHDSDYGKGTDLPKYLHMIAANMGIRPKIERFVMLCYPRGLGYVFNPITVYFGLNADEQTILTIYEVTNTFGERKTYVIPAQPDEDGHVWQQCPKQFFVSPFNKVSGTYRFHLSPIAEKLTLGVALKDNHKPVLRAHFCGEREEFTDRGIVKALAQTGLLTLKVIVGIHFEAAKIWLKGLRTKQKPPPPEHAITYFADPLSGRQRNPLTQDSDRKIEYAGKANPTCIGDKQPDRALV